MRHLGLFVSAVVLLAGLSLTTTESEAEAIPAFPITIQGNIAALGTTAPGELVLESNGTFMVTSSLFPGPLVGDWTWNANTQRLRGSGSTGNRFRGNRSGACFTGQMEYSGFPGTWDGCVVP
jgi:hypothetical protein